VCWAHKKRTGAIGVRSLSLSGNGEEACEAGDVALGWAGRVSREDTIS